MHPWKRQLSDSERSVLLAELLLRHPELAAEAEEITSTLLVVEDDQAIADEITAKLRALRSTGPISAMLLGLYECREDTGHDMVLVQLGLPDAADDLARMVYEKVKRLYLSLPSLADECPEWGWYEEGAH